VEALERLAPDRLAEQVDRLAQHALRGEVWDKAVTYCRQIGAKAHNRMAFREAATCFDQAFVALAYLPESPPRVALVIDLRFDLSVLHLLGEYGQTLAHLDEAEVLAQALDDRARLGRVLIQRTFLLRMRADHPGAIAAGQQALALAEELGMRPLQAHCHRRLGMLYAMTDQREQACAELSAAIALYRAMEMTFWLPQARVSV
jgi:tetratricopeptide (TPR) repeat protein